MKYHVEFDENGGYDCMSAAYLIKNEAGHTVAKIDMAEWLFAQGVPEPLPYDLKHNEAPDARTAALTMAAALCTGARVVPAGHTLLPSDRNEAAVMLSVAESALKP